ncbi:hypothetical protein DM992_40735 (plasmid) [Burkholderia sp. JP2-270]|nr:hypothetical protein DM992_40735 [Burkholderia sp. JP2-270]
MGQTRSFCQFPQILSITGESTEQRSEATDCSFASTSAKSMVTPVFATLIDDVVVGLPKSIRRR